LADRAGDWRHVIVAGAVVSSIIPIALIGTTGFTAIFIVWTLAVIAQMAILPVTDAAALRWCRRNNGDFGRLYGWKTIGYLSVISLSGVVLSWFGAGAFLPLFIGLSLLRGIAALGLPPFRKAMHTSVEQASPLPTIRLMPAWLVLPLVGWSLVNGTHFILNGYLGLHWHQLGYSTQSIGALIALSGIAETAMFFSFRRFIDRLSPRLLILLACVAAVLRWAGLAIASGTVALVFLQLLHALTYALGVLACANFIADSTDESEAAEAQSTFAVIQATIGALALVGFGGIYSTLGGHAFFASAIIAALGAGLVIWSYTIRSVDAGRRG